MRILLHVKISMSPEKIGLHTFARIIFIVVVIIIYSKKFFN